MLPDGSSRAIDRAQPGRTSRSGHARLAMTARIGGRPLVTLGGRGARGALRRTRRAATEQLGARVPFLVLLVLVAGEDVLDAIFEPPRLPDALQRARQDRKSTV